MQYMSTLMSALSTIRQSLDEVNSYIEELWQQVDELETRLGESEYDGWHVSQCDLDVGKGDTGLHGDLLLQAPIKGTGCCIEMRFEASDLIDQATLDDLDDLDSYSLQSYLYLPTPVLRYADGSLGWTPGNTLMGEQVMEAIARYAPQLERAHEALRRFFPGDPRPIGKKLGPAPFDIGALKGRHNSYYPAAITVREGNVWQLNAFDELKFGLSDQVQPTPPDIARDLGIRATSAVLPSHPGVAPAAPGSPEADDSEPRALLSTYYNGDKTAYPFDSFVTSDPEAGAAFLHDLVNEYDRLLGEQTKDKS